MEVELKGQKYVTGKLTPHQQFHCLRRLGPRIIGPMSFLGEADLTKVSDEDFALAIKPLFESIGKMSNLDADYVLNVCLMNVSKRQADKLAPVWIQTGVNELDQSVPVGHFMFQDIDMMVMMGLVQAVLKANLGNFSQGQLANGQ